MASVQDIIAEIVCVFGDIREVGVGSIPTWAAQWKQEETVIQSYNLDKAMHLIDYVRQLLDHRHTPAHRNCIQWQGAARKQSLG